MQRIRGRLSFANVMSVAALFVALGGSAYAIGAGTVGTKQLKNSAVTSQKVDNGSLGAKDLGDEVLTSDEVSVDAGCDTPSPGFLHQGGRCEDPVFDGGGLDVWVECEMDLDGAVLGSLSIGGAESATINGQATDSTGFGNGETLSLFATASSGSALNGTLQTQVVDHGDTAYCGVKGVLIGG